MENKSRNFIKYDSGNPIQKYLIRRFIKTVSKEIKKLNPKLILDAGCGEAFALREILDSGIKHKKIVGVDISSSAIKFAKKLVPEANFIVSDIRSLPWKDSSYDLVVCLETIEHIRNPEEALREIARVSSKYVLLSVPWEPFFSIANLTRLKNISLMGKDPEHVNFWSGSAFKKFIETNGLEIKKHEIVFPWQIVLIKK